MIKSEFLKIYFEKIMEEKLLAVLIYFIIYQQMIDGNQHRHHTISGCSRCPPGYRVLNRCNQQKDTECVPCSVNSYLPHHSYKTKCYICSECGIDLYVAHACNRTTDTVCDSCHTYKGPKNSNYHKRCAKLEESGLVLEQGLARRTIPSTRQIERIKNAENTEDEVSHTSNTYLAMMLVGVGACAIACLITGIVVYSWYGKKKWREVPRRIYRNVDIEDPVKTS